jgi:hypothetical protein
MEFAVICVVLYVMGLFLERKPALEKIGTAMKVTAMILLIGGTLLRAFLRFLVE